MIDVSSETAEPPECVGPVPVDPTPMRAVRDLARDTGTDVLAVLSVTAAVLARRLTRPGLTGRARVIIGRREAVTLPVGTDDAAVGLCAALGRTERYRVSAVPRTELTPPADVTLLVGDDGSRLFVETTTCSADAASAQCWARSFLALLAGLVAEPDRPMADTALLDADERERVVHGLNPHHDRAPRRRDLAAAFAEQADRTPHAVALVAADGTTVTYAELDARANRLAHHLLALGIRRGDHVGIAAERGVAQVVAIHAAVKARAVYVPLDVELPDARLATLLADAAPAFVLADGGCRTRIPRGPWGLVDLADERAWADRPASRPAIGATASDLLHLLYTSGTTGRPKGVAYPAAGVLAHLEWMQRRYPYGPGDTALCKTSPGFDVSVWELFWPLFHGARLVLARPDGHRDPRHLAELVATHRVTTVFLPPTVMAPFLECVDPARTRALRRALCGGEPVTPRIRDTFHALLPGADLVNCYGPTEAGNVTDMVLPRRPGTPVPLGRPAENFRLSLLDEQLEPVPVGMPGEAYIGGGTGLAHAYWNAPARTAERFVADPFGPPGSRLYRTGDLCRYRDDGVLEHLGRIDRQIKIHGLRVEPGEVEAVLAGHPGVENCAVLAHGTPPRLLAFVVPSGPALDLRAVAEHAAATLPAHMCPDPIVPVGAVPATVNGKVDADALLRLVPSDAEPGPVPADDVEARLLALYRRVLATPQMRPLDTFTQLGGHSALAFTLMDACVSELEVKPDVTVLLQGTVRDVAASIRSRS